jgi:hypothetical protein
MLPSTKAMETYTIIPNYHRRLDWDRNVLSEDRCKNGEGD